MAEARLDLVTYDLDGTLIDGTAFLLVARAFGFEKEVLYHDRRFRAGEITLEECFDIEFGFLKGRTVLEVDDAMAHGTWFPGIADAVARLKADGLRVVALTDNPDFITDHLARFGIDEAVASRGVVEDGTITGEVHARFDKWANLRDFLNKEGIHAERVAHVGNDINDVNVWRHVGLGVAVAPTGPAVAERADLVFPALNNHVPIANAILAWHRGVPLASCIDDRVENSSPE